MEKMERSWEQKAQKSLDAVIKSANTKQVEAKTTFVKSYLVSDAILKAAKKVEHRSHSHGISWSTWLEATSAW
jgi:hypothetical protein